MFEVTVGANESYCWVEWVYQAFNKTQAKLMRELESIGAVMNCIDVASYSLDISKLSELSKVLVRNKVSITIPKAELRGVEDEYEEVEGVVRRRARIQLEVEDDEMLLPF